MLTAALTVDLRALTVMPRNRLLQDPCVMTYLIATYGSLTDTSGCAGKMINMKLFPKIHLRDTLTGAYGTAVAAWIVSGDACREHIKSAHACKNHMRYMYVYMCAAVVSGSPHWQMAAPRVQQKSHAQMAVNLATHVYPHGMHTYTYAHTHTHVYVCIYIHTHM